MNTVFQNSAVYCAVIAWGGGLKGIDCFSVTGWDITEEEWKRELSHRIVHIQRASELLGGPNLGAWRKSEPQGLLF